MVCKVHSSLSLLCAKITTAVECPSMSPHGLMPSRVRHLHASSRKVLRTLAVILAAVLLVSLATNTQKARQHVVVSVKHFHEALQDQFPEGQASRTNATSRDPHIPSTVAAHPGTAQLAASTEAKRQHVAGHATAAGSTGANQPAAQGAMLRHHALNPRPTNKTSAGRLDSRTAGMQLYSATAEIPKIIHQNYMSGPQQLLADALRPLSHFRKEWWMSCKTHNPGWEHRFWDAEQCLQLLRERYPWFLETWAALGNSTVLKSDAIRPFILHACGGVYLDLDSECFSDMSPWLTGAQLVLQAEVGHTINNAQMAGVPGHPLWATFQRGIQARVAVGKRWPLETTGPHLLTDVVRKLTNNTQHDLPGRYTLADGSKLAVYGPQQWFTPCAWNDWTCAVKVARDRPLLKAAAAAAVAAATTKAATGHLHGSSSSSTATALMPVTADHGAAGTPATATAGDTVPAASAAASPAAGFPMMLGVTGVAGVHHFSGSWLGLDGSKSLSLRREGVSGAVAFLYTGTGFMQQPCRHLSLIPHNMPSLLDSWPGAAAAAAAGAGAKHSRNPSNAMSSVPVCWEGLSAAVSAGVCHVVSIRGTAASQQLSGSPEARGGKQTQQQAPKTSLWEIFAAELALASAGCTVKLVTDTDIDLAPLIGQQQAAEDQKQQPQTARLSVSSNLAQDSRAKGGPRPGSISSNSSSNVKAMLARISTVTAVLGVAADPFAEPPVLTLDSLVESEKGTSRLTLLVMDTPARPLQASSAHSQASTTLDILNGLYISNSAVLQHVDNLVLTLPPPSGHNGHKAFAAYQHLFQESGFVGYYHSRAAETSTQGGSASVVAASPRVVLGLTRVGHS